MVDAEPRKPGRARISLAHDWLCGRRGGEMVLERLALLVESRYEPAGLYTMFDDGRGLSPAVDRLSHHRSWLSPLSRSGLRRWALPLYPSAVAQLRRQLEADHARRPIDLLISSSSAAVKGLRPPPGVPHLCYCHSPARYLWSRGADYAEGSPLRRAGLALFGPALRRWDARTSATVTRFLANSTHIAAEIERCYGRTAEVVFPPVRTAFFTPDPGARREDFWLAAGALEPYKRADAAILAARRAGAELRIVGEGSERARLERLASGVHGVTFLGRIPDEALRDLYRRARLLVFPQVEDFGLVALEAQACGLPVIARREGGALDTVTEQTGAFFDEPTPEAIAAAASRAPRNADACRRHAEQFSEAAFDRAMRLEIERALAASPQRAASALPV